MQRANHKRLPCPVLGVLPGVGIVPQLCIWVILVNNTGVWAIVLLAAWLYRLRVAVVYADAAYFDRRFVYVMRHLLGAFAAVDDNSRRQGKRQLASRDFIRWWKRRVLWPRRAIERHFAWLKRYFGLQDFQRYTCVRVSQYVVLTYIAVAVVALAAYRTVSRPYPSSVVSFSLCLNFQTLLGSLRWSFHCSYAVF